MQEIYDTAKIKSNFEATPMIYGYATPTIPDNNGLIKIGYTIRSVEERVKEQAHTINVDLDKIDIGLRYPAFFNDENCTPFTDKEFHAYLRRNKIEQIPNHEWFRITFDEAKQKFISFQNDFGILKELKTDSYTLRDEQLNAISKTRDYVKLHPKKGEFLWNAKPRFGKTLTAYSLCKEMDAKTILIITNRPAIANSWYDDYEKYFGMNSGYMFISRTQAIKKDASLRYSYADYEHELENNPKLKLIYFVSLQDLKGSRYFSTTSVDEKYKEIKDTKWDVLIIDEAHEGVDTDKTDDAISQINCNFTLHLSGTPFKALANSKFPSDAIFNWTYADEQRAKENWDNGREEENPYELMPKLNMYTYQMSNSIIDEFDKGMEIDGEHVKFTFTIQELFKAENKTFIHENDVEKFIDNLSTNDKYPFSKTYRNELKHTLWLLDRIESVKALAKMLRNHPVFKEYEIIEAVGKRDSGNSEDEEQESDYQSSIKNSYDKVKTAISKFDKTITLTVGQLTTGVTVPEWSAVLMLSNIRSPAKYIQTAFRAQNPYVISNNRKLIYKQNSYIFDFNPERALSLYEEFATKLSGDSLRYNNDTLKNREDNVKHLLNFFPVVSMDENGTMGLLDSNEILSIPRDIRSTDVVNSKFMSNFLFQNITNIFSAPDAIREILDKFEPYDYSGKKKDKNKLADTNTNDLPIDENGDVQLTLEYLKQKEKLIDNKPFYEELDKSIDTVKNKLVSIQDENNKARNEEYKNVLKYLCEETSKEESNKLVKSLEENGHYSKISKSAIIKASTEERKKVFKPIFSNLQFKEKDLFKERENRLQNRDKTGESVSQINKDFEEKHSQLLNNTMDEIERGKKILEEKIPEIAISIAEDAKTVEIVDNIQEGIRKHLRGFSRTIPSFLMAYAKNHEIEPITLATFENGISDDIFKDITGITIDEFKTLRDGKDMIDSKTGEKFHYEGHLFDEIVFNDSVDKFLKLKDKLSNYFDESSEEIIFDYIPNPKTNQVFTPRNVVIEMVDMLEAENPKCFDCPDNTFADLHMKSGMYIAEIVKRLYNSPKLKEQFPSRDERLKHIFEKQVYGLAPTGIIYNIAVNYIMGFDDNAKYKHNFKECDVISHIKAGTLDEEIDRLYS